jgi:DSF synthase
VHQVTYEELLDVVGLWVDAALRLTTRDLKLMQRLVSRQNGLQEPAPAVIH